MNVVESILKSYLQEPEQKVWIDDLISGDNDCKRLAYCLAIELKKTGFEVVDPDHLKKIFENWDYDHTAFKSDLAHPRKWFAKKLDSVKVTLKNKNGCIIPAKEFIDAAINRNKYSSFLTFYRLKKYYLDPYGYKVRPDSPDVAGEIAQFVLENPDLLDKLDVTFGGTFAPVWVTTREDADHIKTNVTSYETATNIMNCLGLQPDEEGLTRYPHTGNMFFQVDYPDHHSITAYQPSCLNKNWVDALKDLYLSNVQHNKFGLTYTTDSSCLCCSKEQIHEGFICKDRGLMISFVGQHSSLPVNKSAILTEGDKRLKK
jgi:hypothetical protein